MESRKTKSDHNDRSAGKTSEAHELDRMDISEQWILLEDSRDEDLEDEMDRHNQRNSPCGFLQ